eukprot:7377280-Prymnesium_polylepis.2
MLTRLVTFSRRASGSKSRMPRNPCAISRRSSAVAPSTHSPQTTSHMSYVDDPVLRRPSAKRALASIEEKQASAPQRLAHTSHTRSPCVTWPLPLPVAGGLDDCRLSRWLHPPVVGAALLAARIPAEAIALASSHSS